ncbi:MAG: FHA domain-containing protein [Pseudomonadota bacterium]
MIKIQVREKNGAPRDLTFEKILISIGRSARNDVILPRSNISKQHVTVEVVSDKCVLTDLGSTNGTFVNGQKITGPVVVGIHDNIFVSDFALKVCFEDEEVAELSGVHEIIEPTERGGRVETPAQFRPTVEGPPPLPSRQSASMPPPLPSERPASAPPALPPEPPAQIVQEKQRSTRKGKKKAGSQKVEQAAAPAPMEHQDDTEEIRKVYAAIYRKIHDELALDKIDMHSLGSEDFSKKSSRIIAEVVDKQLDSGTVPSSLEPHEITELLQSELLGLGPIDDLLANPSIREFSVLPSGNVVLFNEQGPTTLLDPFISPESRAFVLRKLIHMSGSSSSEGDPIVTGSLNGASVKAVSPPLARGGLTLSVAKPPDFMPVNLENLVKHDIMSSKMEALFQYCLQMRRGILIADPLCLSHKTLMPALASSLPGWERIAVVQCGNEPIENIDTDLYFKMAGEGTETFSFSRSGEHFSSVLPSFQPTVIFAGEISSAQVLRVARMSASSQVIVIASIREPGPLDSIEKLKQIVFNEFPDLDSESMIKMAVAGFSLVVGYTRMMDRRDKVSVVSDIQIGRDGRIILKPIFQYEVREVDENGEISGSFRSTRTVPSFIEGKRQRGAQIDTSIFQ